MAVVQSTPALRATTRWRSTNPPLSKIVCKPPISGTLLMTQKFTKTIATQEILTGAGDVLVSPDRKNVYVTTRTSDRIVVFTRATNGQLTYLDSYHDGEDGMELLDFPGNMTISADGRFLYVPAYSDHAINVFKRAKGDGGLELIQTIPGVTGVFDLAGSGRMSHHGCSDRQWRVHANTKRRDGVYDSRYTTTAQASLSAAGDTGVTRCAITSLRLN